MNSFSINFLVGFFCKPVGYVLFRVISTLVQLEHTGFLPVLVWDREGAALPLELFY